MPESEKPGSSDISNDASNGRIVYNMCYHGYSAV